jgi:hypothetical protein
MAVRDSFLPQWLFERRHLVGAVALGLAVSIAIAPDASAHGVSGKDALFLLSLNGPAIIPLMYLGAKHMVTGYDHLLFLVGVVFFLYRLKDILLYVSLFTIGHSVTLLAGAIGGIHANAFIVDAIIGLSISSTKASRTWAASRRWDSSRTLVSQSSGSDSCMVSDSPLSCRTSTCRRTGW